MYIHRDITDLIYASSSLIKVLLGPRQCGKSTLFASLYTHPASKKNTAKSSWFKEITFDDLQMRQLANSDPALFLQQFEPPLLLDEVQYAPLLFPELKIIVDKIKRARTLQGDKSLAKTVLFCLTGSNQILMDRNIKESLAGRASYFYLNTLTVHEILNALPEIPIKEIIFKGGWPELYINNHLSITAYLNDYIRSYVEKDIIMAAGIQKTAEFLTVLRLCAARTAQETDYSDIQKDSGVSSVTVKEWISVLERAELVYLLRPFFNNLNKRLIKRSKLIFLDTGLAVRLQGWSEQLPLLNSPQIGGLFETLVIAEIVKYIRNYGKDWELFFWRTKDNQEEIDIMIRTAQGLVHAFEVKYAIHGVSHSISYPPAFQKMFSPKVPLVIVTSGGKKLKLSPNCIVVPIADLHDYLQEI